MLAGGALAVACAEPLADWVLGWLDGEALLALGLAALITGLTVWGLRHR